MERRVMSPEEIHALMGAIGWGVLSAVDAGGGAPQPIAVPVAYATAEGAVYLGIGPGRKLRALEANPRLCLTVAEVRDAAHWRSAALMGSARWLVGPAERGLAIAAIAAQRAALRQPLSPRDASRLLEGRLARVELEEVHGYACGVEPEPAACVETPPEILAPCELPAAEASDAATRVMDAVRRLVRALRTTEGAATRELGLSGAQLFVLRQLSDRSALTMSELARRTLSAQSSLSEVVARLVQRGLVARTISPRDRRRTSLSLTDAGRTALARAPEPAQQRLVAALHQLPDAEVEALARGMERWMEVGV